MFKNMMGLEKGSIMFKNMMGLEKGSIMFKNMMGLEEGSKIVPEWLQYNVIKMLLPSKVYAAMRNAILYRPEDPNNLHQVLPQRHTAGLNVDRIKGYRYPAPGSRHGAKVPIRDHEDQNFNPAFFTRNSANLPKKYVIGINAQTPLQLSAEQVKQGSPGNANPAVLAYDPTGLRSTMSATWKELDKAVLENTLPNHLPGPEWLMHIDEMNEISRKKNIPLTLGRRWAGCDTAQNYNDRPSLIYFMMDDDFNPSSYGFRSIRPKSRVERRGLFDKVLLEKSRIDQRVGFEARIHQANAPANSSLLTSCMSEGAGYISNADRFHSDTAGEEYAARHEALQKKNRAIEYRRNQSVTREEDRWQQIESKRNDDDEYARRLRDDGMACKKNTSNVAYDILNLQYNQDTGGEQQKYVDDMVKYRAQLRSRNLIIKGDTRSNFDIISGDARQSPSLPPHVRHPSNAADSMVKIDFNQYQNQPQQRGQGHHHR